VKTFAARAIAQDYVIVPDNPILLVEDRDSNRMVALLLLQKLGFGVDVVCSGLEAVEAACKRNYKCILMDVQMPEFDGFDATRAIREAEAASGRHTPIIALTALAMEGDEQRCLAAGMDDYISKPYNLQTLKETLEKYLPSTNAAQ
jgi:two-component system, sensor histidine kinase and response regulator